jgi:pimeloyl-ACP methyl ester carboxylesterase
MNPINLLFFIAGLVMVSCDKESEDPVIDEMSAVRGYENWFINDFRCGLFVPADYDRNKKYPLIIFLHGRTDTTTWNLPWYNEPYITIDPCIVLTPKCPPEDIYGWGSSYDPRTSPMMAKAYEMISMAEKAFNLDKNRYYIYGSSMGGYGTYGAIKKNPDMFAAGYVECGNGSIDIAPILAKIPFWMFHGSDDPVVPVQPTRDLYQAVLDQGGTQIRYTEYKDVGHNVWDYTPRETTLKTWFLAQRKGSVHGNPLPVNGFTGEMIEGKIVLQWEVPDETYPPSDFDIWYCRIYRDGNVIQEVYNNEKSYTDSSVVLNHTYTYRISAANYYFKESEKSSEISILVTDQ